MAGLSLHQLADFGPVYGPRSVVGRVPGVVILHGSEGPMAGWAHRFAAILAAEGMLALPLGYGEGDFWAAGPIREVDLRRVAEAGRALAADPRCSGVGLLGWSFGAGAALLVTAFSGRDPFGCVVAHAGADVVTPAFDPAARRAGQGVLDHTDNAHRAFVWPGEEAALTPLAPIPVERITVPVMLTVGDADMVMAPERTLRVAKRLAQAGKPADLWVAAGQGHGFDFDTEPQFWARLVAFFGKHLGA
ncbi:MAG: prolyl oligopeptidase family serine peptidase [Gemmobacter sp.]|nr:prolyl oligopeptidase family serine peptidase [Gemmobacter sp.]